jgi:hypothetical protein
MYLDVQGSPTGWSTPTGLTPVFMSCSRVASSTGVQAFSEAHGGCGTIRTVTAAAQSLSAVPIPIQEAIPAATICAVNLIIDACGECATANYAVGCWTDRCYSWS